MKSLVLVRLSKCVPANHSEEMEKKKRGGKGGRKKKKSMTHFSKFDNKRDGKRAGRRELPLNSFLSLASFFLAPLTDVI